MTLDILRRSGGWAVELAVPIKHAGRQIDVIEIRPPDMQHIVRWGRGQIPSSMALLAELSGVPEMALRSITYPDADRVLLALFNVVPQQMKNDFTSGKAPLATPEELMPEDEPGTRAVDQDDPRFPMADGLVRPLRSQPTGGIGLDLNPLDPMKQVG
jgi:hypothetical protein